MKNQSLLSRVVTLGSASMFDYAIQLILPIALVRLLEGEEYAKYRMLFLLVNTAMALAPLYMPQALFYFLPKAKNPLQRAAYIANTMLFLMVTGSIAAIILNPWWPIIPAKFYSISQNQFLIPFFILMWVVGSLIDTLPNANNQIRWQAGVTIFLSILRVTSIVITAWQTGNIEKVFFVLCIFIALKVFLLLIFVKINFRDGLLIIDKNLLHSQLRYAIPFGMSSALYMMKVQSDQWIAAYLFTPVMYAVFSFGIYIAPLMTLLRNAINNAALPSMSQAYADGNMNSVIAQFRKVNYMMALCILPILAVLFSAADRIINFLFTETYTGAAAVMQIYIIGFIAQCLESTTLLRLCSAGKYVMKLNAILLPVAVGISFFCAQQYGLIGAAMGSVTTLFIGEIVNLRLSSRLMGLRFSEIIDWRAWIAILLAALIAASTGTMTSYSIDFGALLDVIVISIVIFIVYVVILLIANALNVINIKSLRGRHE